MFRAAVLLANDQVAAGSSAVARDSRTSQRRPRGQKVRIATFLMSSSSSARSFRSSRFARRAAPRPAASSAACSPTQSYVANRSIGRSVLAQASTRLPDATSSGICSHLHFPPLQAPVSRLQRSAVSLSARPINPQSPRRTVLFSSPLPRYYK